MALKFLNNATFAGTISSGAITSTANISGVNLLASTAVYSGGVIYGASTLSLKKSNGNSYVDFDTNLNATFAGYLKLSGPGDASGRQIHFLAATGESNTEPMRIVRYQDKMYFTYGTNSGDDAFWINSDGTTQFEENATFAGNVRVSGWIKGASDTNTLYSSTSLGTYLQSPTNSGTGGHIYFRNNSGTVFQTFSQVDGSATFAGNVIVTDGSDTATLSKVGLTLNRGNSYIQSDADNSDTLNIGQSSVRWGHVKVDGADFAVLNGGNERFIINSVGNVGIGTTSPQSLLHLSATSGLTPQVKLGQTSSYQLQIGYNNSSEYGFLQAYGANLSTPDDIVLNQSGGNVGIGTTSPANKLVVETSTAGDYAALINNTHSTTGYGLLARTASTGTSSYAFAARAGVSDIFVVRADGNVGIGTTSPSYKFSVNNKFMVTSNGSAFIPSGQGIGIDPYSGGVNTNIYFNTGIITIGGVTDFKHNNANFIVKNNGNVGIGTISPSAPLEIAGVASATDTGITIKNGSATRLRLFHNDNAGASYLTTYRGVQAAQRLIIESGNDLNLSGGGGSAHMVIKTSGKVGIGTTSPSSVLHVDAPASGGGAIFSTLGYNYATVSQLISSADAVFGGGVIAGSTAAQLVKTVADVAHFVKVQITDGITFHTNVTGAAGTTLNRTANERMRITSAGNVGIGTDNPGSKLEVKTSGFNSAVEIDNSDSQYSIVQHNALGATKGFSGYNSGFMIFGGEAGVTTRLQAGGNYAATILTNGNVGIGTTSPGAKFHVKSSVVSEPLALFQTTTVGDCSVRIEGVGGETYLEIASTHPSSGDTSNSWGIGMNDNKNLTFGWGANNTLNKSTRLIIEDTGNVGIGTTSPAAKLDVFSAASFRADVATGNPLISIVNNTAISNTAGTATIKFTQGNTQAGGKIVSGRDGNYSSGATRTSNLQFYTSTAANDTEKMRINSDGNVGIGTTSPTEKLVVDGKVIINNTNPPNNFAQLNIGYTGSGETRAIDLHGSWSNGESKSISFTYSNSLDALVGQINCRYNGPGSSIKWGRLYHSGNSSAYTMELASTSTTTANLTVAGSIQMANDTATASADKVGTMRYRTGTEYVEVTGTEILSNPGFDTDTTWVKGTGWTIANGKASVDNASSTALSQPSFGVTTGKIYNVRIDVSNYTSGSLQPQFGPSQVIASITANGEYNYTVTSTVTGGIFYLYGVGDCEFSIDNASVIEVEAESASYADMCMQTGSSTYEWVNIVRNTY